MKLLEVLHSAGFLTHSNLLIVEHFAKKWDLNCYDALLETHVLSDHALADAIAEIFRLDRLYSFDSSEVDLTCLSLLSFSEAISLQCFIPGRDDNGQFLVNMLSPIDDVMNSVLKKKLTSFRSVILDKKLLNRAIDEAYPLAMQLPSLSLPKNEE